MHSSEVIQQKRIFGRKIYATLAFLLENPEEGTEIQTFVILFPVKNCATNF